MAEHVHLRWAEESANALRALPREVASKNGGPLRGAMFAGGKTIKAEIVKNVPVGQGTPNPGNLRRQVFLARDRDPAAIGMTEHYFISVRVGRRGLSRLKLGSAIRALTGNDAWYWIFLEFGTVKQPAQAPLRRGFESAKGRALEVIRRELQVGIPRAAERARRKSGVPA